MDDQDFALHAPGLEDELTTLYFTLLDAWNRQQAREFAALFSAAGATVGFDGSPLDGAAQIEAALAQIFADHPTGKYVGIVREVRALSATVGQLRAVAGMVPRGQTEINPAVNAVQTLVAAQSGGRWRIELFQNTPAAFHGRPETSAALTAELQAAQRGT